jgi:uncharacterized YigZ family protein
MLFTNDNENYRTIKALSQGVYKEKGSRFIAFAYPVSSQEEIKPIIDKIRKEYHDAKHHCYAYMLGQDRQTWRVNDDGEPSGTAGKPILGQINSADLTNILIVVVRYFGGTLLGVSGLINAYRSAAAGAIKNSEIIEKTLHEYHEITFPYSAMNDVMKILKEEGAGQSGQKMDMECTVKISFRLMAKERILNRLSRIEGLKIRYTGTY